MFKLIIAALLLTPSAYSQDTSGLNISAAADILYEQGINKASQASEKLEMRSAELSLSSAIDHNFSGVISLASHAHEGENNFELHELYIENSSFIPRSTFKVGKFFLGIGRLNRFHRHDWYFTDTPLVNKEFFAEEAVFDSGAEYNYLLPTDSIINLTLGVTTGTEFGHTHDHDEDEDDDDHDHETEGAKAQFPTHYMRLSHFKEFSSSKAMETAVNFLRKKDAHGEEVTFVGLDYLLKNRIGKTNTFILQSELWFKTSKEENIKQEDIGVYIFNEYSVLDSSSIGLRADVLKNITSSANVMKYGLTGQYTFNSSEFSKIRGSLSHELERDNTGTLNKDTKAMLQIVFILGSHPAHVF